MSTLIRLIIRWALTAAAFSFVLPLIPGFSFQADLPTTLGCAVLFSVASFVIAWFLQWLYLLIGAATLGCGCFVFFPVLLLQGLIVPTLGLQAMAHYFPQQISVEGWVPAILGGLVLMVINAVTQDYSSLSSSSSRTSSR